MIWGTTLDKKITLEPSFVIHTRAFSETSLIADLFTRNHGKLSVIAKGARRPKSKLKVIQTPSSLFSVSCLGRNELKTLIDCEITEYFDPSPESYNCLVYLNELLSKLLEKEDAHEKIFDQYLNVCRFLKDADKNELEINLRMFEFTLLKEIGYGLDFINEASSRKKISELSTYKFDPTLGFLPLLESDVVTDKNHFSGKDILNFSKGNLENTDSRKASKQIMRQALDFHLGSKSLKIREYLSKKGVQS